VAADKPRRSAFAPREAPGPATTVPIDAARATSLLRQTAVGVMAHDEAAMIGPCLEAILAERAGATRVPVVVVVASGCSDDTVDVARQIAARDPRTRVIVEPERNGKAAAINRFLASTTHPYCALIGADVLLTPGALSRLVAPLADETYGMTGAHVVPTNPRGGLAGNVVHTLWELHHELARMGPKLGEAVVFRRLFDEIPTNSLVDEVSIEQQVRSTGVQLRYVEDAVVHNFGPERIDDYLRQRERVHRGHLGVRRNTGYSPMSMNTTLVARAVARYLIRRPERLAHVTVACALETLARSRARYQDMLHGAPESGVWPRIGSSKRAFHPSGASNSTEGWSASVPGRARGDAL
jgi:poly-beta-1,6-N-acetyl-D-glucosamine synthase